MKWLLWAAVGGMSCAACGGSGVGKPIAQFPSQADLNDVASGTRAPPKGSPGMADVDSWQMQAPEPQPARYPNENNWDRLALSTAQAHGNSVALSPELRCAAQEAARFYTVNSGMPDDGLREHLLLRCGSALAGHSFAYVTQQTPDSVSAAEVENSMRNDVQKMLDSGFHDAHAQLGLGWARGSGRYAVVQISGIPRAVLRDFSPIVQGSSVTLSGEVRVPAEYLVALATKGSYGVARCDFDPLQHLPAFRVTCPIAEGDVATRIEIATKEQGRVLLEGAAQVEVRRDEQAELQYNAAAYGDNKTVASSAQFRSALLTDLNQVRKAAGLQPFALESQQSVTNDRLAPYLFETMFNGNDQQAATITLGLLAGWDVHGLIQDGGIFCSSANSVRNPSRWLTQALNSPLGRWVLLEPKMSRIGIGASELTPSGEMALVTTYSFFDSTDHAADEATVIAELDRQRAAHRLGPVHRVNSDAAMQKALRQINLNAITSDEALHTVMQETVATTNRGVSGSLVETTDVRQMKFEAMYLSASTLDIEVGVTHYRAPGAAWGQFAVLFIVTNHGAQTQEAKRASPRAPFTAW